MTYAVAQAAAILATALFIFSLYWMNDPKTARHAVVAGVTGMVVAVLATWFQPEIVHHGWIVLAIVAGFLVGVPLSLVPLTAVPQRTALSHAFGGLAAASWARRSTCSGERASGAAHGLPDERHHRRGDPRIPDVHR